MESISLRELHERTGAWVHRGPAGAFVVTERGKPLVRLEPVSEPRPANPFRLRRLRPGFRTPPAKLGEGTDSTTIISEDRDRNSPS